MNIELDLKKKIDNIKVNIDGINKISKNNIDLFFENIRKSKNVEELLYNINKCNNEINDLNIFTSEPIVKISSYDTNNVLVNYLIKEKKNNYIIGTNINNRGEVSVDLDINIPYIFKKINSIELIGSISSLYAHNFCFRFIIPYIHFLKNYKLILESNINSLNNIKYTSYISKSNSFKTYLLKNNNSFIYELSFNNFNKIINKNFICSDKILKLCDKYFKHTIKYIFKYNNLKYENINNVTSLFPTSGYYFEIENECSLPFSEAQFFKNQINFSYSKKIFNNIYSLINFSNGIKYDLDDKFSYINNYNFTGNIGHYLMLRGFEYNKVGFVDNSYTFNKKKKKFEITYDYLGANFLTNIQFLFYYIFKFKNINPIIFFYIQIGKLSNKLKSSIQNIINDTRMSLGFGLKTYLQKNISLELFFALPFIYQKTDKRKYFQVGLNLNGNI